MPSSFSSPLATPSDIDPLLERLRLFGPGDLEDAELLSVALAPEGPLSSLPFSSAILSEAGGLGRFTSLTLRSLEKEFGLSERKALGFVAHREITERIRVRAARRHLGQRLTPASVFAWARELLATLEHEEVWLVLVSAASRMEDAVRVARGGSHGCALLPKDVLRAAVRGAAAAFVLVHNHPSGDPRPSDEDLTLTERLIPLADALGCPLLDHIIVAGGTYRSLRAEGLCFRA